MKIMAPDDPTSVYPIGQTGLDDEDDDSQPEPSDHPVPAAAVPPIEPDVDALSASEEAGGGFNPLIAVAVLAFGGVLALGLLGLVTGILLLIN